MFFWGGGFLIRLTLSLKKTNWLQEGHWVVVWHQQAAEDSSEQMILPQLSPLTKYFFKCIGRHCIGEYTSLCADPIPWNLFNRNGSMLLSSRDVMRTDASVLSRCQNSEKVQICL